MNPCYIITKNISSHSLLSNKEYFKKNQKYYLYLQIKNKYQIAEDFI